jgi:acyl-[acyl carrier protein]--UDP-N-acetylglucosamine O-acyltransferase
MAANLISQLSTANTFQHWLGATQSLIGTANLLTDGNGQTFFANTRIRVGGTSANVSLNVETGATINVITANTTNTVNLQSKEVVVTGNITSLTTITMNTGTGTYQTGELVFQGPNNNVTYANSTAIVQSWNTTSNVLSLIQLSGTFNADTNTYAQLSGANWTTINVSSGFSYAKPNVTLPSNVLIQRDLFVDGNTRVTGNTTIIGDLTVSGNITLDTIGFDDLSVAGSATVANTLSVTKDTTLSANLAVANNVTIGGNVATLKVTTTADIGSHANIAGSVYIAGDLTIGGNVTLDTIGFDDLTVSGNGTFGNNVTIGGNTAITGSITIAGDELLTGTLGVTGNAIFGNVTITGTLNAERITGNANTAIYASIELNDGSALAYSIALG